MHQDGKKDDKSEEAAEESGGQDLSSGLTPDDGARGDESPPRSIPKDDAFHLLQNARRRAVLRYLLDHPAQERFRMRDIAEAVAAWENDTTVGHLKSEQRQRVYIALYQSHLPKIDSLGVLEYDQSRGIVEPMPLLAALEPLLEEGLHADTQALTIDSSGRPDSAGSARLTSIVTSFRSGL